ncbi:MAG: nitroreductase family protein [Acidimicrobiales bacterium]
MEFREVVGRRRMVRAFTTEPVDTEILDRMLSDALRSPSAGNSQGRDLVVLEGPEQTATFWNLTLPAERRRSFAWPGLLAAPVIVVPLADPQRYLDRYSQPDKETTGLGASEDAWPVPYWTIDTAFATMTLLHAAVDAGLGALFFGIFRNEAELMGALGVPDHLRPIGAVAIGHPAPEHRRGRSADRPRRGLSDAVHRGSWGGSRGR